MSSRFTIASIIVALVLSLMAPFVIYLSAISPAAGLLIPVLYLLLVIFFWLTEFRTRAHRIVLEDNGISVRAYYNFGNSKIFRYSEFDGFITSQQPGRWGPKEYVFLIRKGKRQVCISEFYHRNYFNLKEVVEKKLPFLGEKEYNFSYEYKQMFR